MTNPYAAIRTQQDTTVLGRDVIREIDPNDPKEDIELGDLPRVGNEDTYFALGRYLPMPPDQEIRELFVIRSAPKVTAVINSYLKLHPSGDWSQTAVTALTALRFRSRDDHPHSAKLPLRSVDPIDLKITGTDWVGYDHVEFDYLPPPLDKFYSRVKFKNTLTKQKVAAFWCWPK